MEVTTVAFVTACAALVSAAGGPFVSIVVSSRQIRASLVSGNRERWIEALRDTIAEYVGLALSVRAICEVRQEDALSALRESPELIQLGERLAQAKNRIELMINPGEPEQRELSERIERVYRHIIGDFGSAREIGSMTDDITRAGRAVLKSEWARVKRGD